MSWAWIIAAGPALVWALPAAGRLLARRASFVHHPLAAIAGRSPLATSGWGGGVFESGMRLNGALRVERYADGYRLLVMGIFGGGQRWLPDVAIHRVVHQRALIPLLIPSRAEIVLAAGRIVLLGSCARLLRRFPPGGRDAA